jgi:electron transport complex protein RnfG
MKKSLSLIIVLSLTCVVASLSLALVNELTEGRIEKEQKIERLSSISKVLPEFNNDPLIDKKAIANTTFYIGKYNGRITGIACEGTGQGYSGSIRVMVGISPEGEVSGIEILEHLETPGLGSRIENEEFRAQFKGKSLADSKLVNGNLAVKNDLGDIDALSGATISSRGVTRAVNQALHLFQTHRTELVQ